MAMKRIKGDRTGKENRSGHYLEVKVKNRIMVVPDVNIHGFAGQTGGSHWPISGGRTAGVN